MRKYRHRSFVQGIFRPRYPDKCISTECAYRSSYELKFMRWCDKTSNVIKWGSETISIPYQSPVDGRVHRYYPDNVIILKEKDKYVKYLIEIKPEKQTRPPNTVNRKNKQRVLYEQVTYAKNMAKWDAARQWATKNGYVFKILTEKELQI